MNTIRPESSIDSRTEMSPPKLKKACADFESIFLNYLLKSMRSSAQISGGTEKSMENRIMSAMFDERLVEQISAGGGIGLADVLYEQLKDRIE